MDSRVLGKWLDKPSAHRKFVGSWQSLLRRLQLRRFPQYLFVMNSFIHDAFTSRMDMAKLQIGNKRLNEYLGEHQIRGTELGTRAHSPRPLFRFKVC